MQNQNSTPVRTVAVIDIGTTSIRMQIADVGGNGVSVLETLFQVVGLGKDTFSTGEIGRSTIEDCVSVLRNYRSKLEEYQIRPEDVRVVATSAVREATNRLAFIDRVYVATGLSVEPIDVAEVHRITYRSIQPLLKAQPMLFEAVSAIVEVSGGSTEVLMLDQGNVNVATSIKLGTSRLQPFLGSMQIARHRLQDVLEKEISALIDPLIERIPHERASNLIAMGGDARFAARQLLGVEPKPGTLQEISTEQLRNFAHDIIAMSDEELVDEYHLSFADAETVGPALLAYVQLAELLNVDRILVSSANLRDGLLREMSEGGSWTEDFHGQILRSAWELAGRYHVDEDHAQQVAGLASQLFRLLQPELALPARYETLLRVAAILHETGSYINSSAIHKHSMYIVLNSEIFGLTADDVLIVGLLVRYHRRAFPKPTHQPYSSLDRDKRVVVCKLAAILRLAIVLDTSRSQRITSLNIERVRDRVIISVPGIDDLAVEQLALPPARSFFELIFGKKIVLRPDTTAVTAEVSSQL